MGYTSRLLPLFFVASVVSSCTCHRDVEQVAEVPASAQRPAGFRSSHPTVVVPTVSAPQAMPPTVPQVAPPLTPPAGVAGLPGDFPADVPLMKDAEVAMVQQLPGDARNVLLRTEDDRKTVYEFYQKDLPEKGWVLEQHYQAKEQSFLGFRKGKTIVNMVITQDPKTPGKQLVAIMYQEDRPPEFGDF